MTTFGRQRIPFRRWGYQKASTVERDAIDTPIRGAFCHIPGQGFWQWTGTVWMTVSTLSAFPIQYVYSKNDPAYSGSTFNLPGYTFPDPIFITEDEGNLIFDVYIGGIKQYYRSSGLASLIGEFEIDPTFQNLVFPVALDGERIQVKAFVL